MAMYAHDYVVGFVGTAISEEDAKKGKCLHNMTVSCAHAWVKVCVCSCYCIGMFGYIALTSCLVPDMQLKTASSLSLAGNLKYLFRNHIVYLVVGHAALYCWNLKFAKRFHSNGTKCTRSSSWYSSRYHKLPVCSHLHGALMVSYTTGQQVLNYGDCQERILGIWNVRSCGVLVSEQTVKRAVQQYFALGDLLNKYSCRRLRSLSENNQAVLLQLLLDNLGIYIHEVQEMYEGKAEISLHPTLIIRYANCFGLMWQRMCLDIDRAEFDAGQSHGSCFLCLGRCDHRTCLRRMAYSVKGTTPHYLMVQVRGKYLSAFAALSVWWIEDSVIHEGNVDGDLIAFWWK